MASKVTRTAKTRKVSKMNRKRASTLPAKLEACSGKNGSGDCTVLMCSLRRRTRPEISATLAVVFAPAENDKPDGHAKKRHNPAHADDGEDSGAVAGLRWIVL